MWLIDIYVYKFVSLLLKMKQDRENVPDTPRVERQEIIDDPNLMAMIALLMVLSLQWFYTQCTC